MKMESEKMHRTKTRDALPDTRKKPYQVYKSGLDFAELNLLGGQFYYKLGLRRLENGIEQEVTTVRDAYGNETEIEGKLAQKAHQHCWTVIKSNRARAKQRAERAKRIKEEKAQRPELPFEEQEMV